MTENENKSCKRIKHTYTHTQNKTAKYTYTEKQSYLCLFSQSDCKYFVSRKKRNGAKKKPPPPHKHINKQFHL